MMDGWMGKALCKGKAQDFWFPPLETPNMTQYYNVGKQLCDRCPVWDECLEAGTREVMGMWGGLIPKERSGSTLREHGTVTRYRQGCHCVLCSDAAYRQLPAFPYDIIPDSGSDYDIVVVKKSVQEVVNSYK